MLEGYLGGARNLKEIRERYKAVKEASIATQSKKIGDDLDHLDDQFSKELDQLIQQNEEVAAIQRKVLEAAEKALGLKQQKEALSAEIEHAKKNNPQDPVIVDKQLQLDQIKQASASAQQKLDQLMPEWGGKQNTFNEQLNNFQETHGQLRELNNALFRISTTSSLPPTSPLDSPVPFNNLAKIFAISPIARVEATEEDWYELAKHIVLVHAIALGSIRYNFAESYDLPDESKEFKWLALERSLTVDGEMGSHLDWHGQQFRGTLLDRPHLHWAWNQLVQKHGRDGEGNLGKFSWEDSPIAILEPMHIFEHLGSNEATFGIAPYDTMTVGKHRLSELSTLLVPSEIEDEARTYLARFKGKIVGYRHSPIRKPIFETIQSHYPDTWHIVDPMTGKKLGAEEKPTTLGYFDVTCLEKNDGSRLTLITGSGKADEQIKSLAMLHGKKLGKFIGLHDSGPTVILEESHSDFKDLKSFKEKNPLLSVKKPVFVGYDAESRDISRLVVLKSFRFRKEMSIYAASTQAGVVGDYVFREALHADMTSVLSANFPDSPLDFTPHELNAMISRHGEHILHILEALDMNVRNQALSKKYFDKYRALLLKAIQSMMKAREKLSTSLANADHANLGFIQLLIDGNGLKNEWRQVRSQEVKAGDFDKRWPLTQQEKEFLVAVRNLLPYDVYALTSALNGVREKIGAASEGEERDKLRYLEYSLKLYLKEIYYLSDDQEVVEIMDSFPYGLRYLEKTLQIGNGLFDNVAYQMKPSASMQELKIISSMLREKSVNYMRNHPGKFQDFFEGSGLLMVGSGLERYRYSNWNEYLAGLAMDNVWADERVLKAISETIDSPLVKLRPGQQRVDAASVYYSEGEGQPIFIAHVRDNQFASLRPVSGTTPREIFTRM